LPAANAADIRYVVGLVLAHLFNIFDNHCLMQTRYCLVLLFCGSCLPLSGQDDSRATDDASQELAAPTEEIRAAVSAYVTAFNAQNVDALSKLWTPEGVYTIRSTGERVLGRKSLEAQFKAILTDQEKAPQLAVETESIEFLSPRVALEHGTAIVTQDDEVRQSEYTAVYVKTNEQWLIDRITEEEILAMPSHYEHLQGLEWLIGQWVDAGEGFTIEMECNWTANQTYISRKFAVSNDEGFTASGLQIIGWDARDEEIRSWLFDSSGGFVNGTWTQRDGQWVVQSVATLADGSSGSFTSIFRPQDDGTYTWQKINQVVDGKLLPNLDEITVRRIR